MDTVTIYISGQCEPNPGLGAWAAALYFQDAQKIKSGVFQYDVTNQEAELQAAIEALLCLNRRCAVDLHSCNQVTVRIASGDYKTESYPELWGRLRELETVHLVTWHWTPKTDKRLNEVRHHALSVLMHPEAME